jgi:hypothetical protein
VRAQQPASVRSSITPSWLRCWLPDTPDVHDVIAQLSAGRPGTLTSGDSRAYIGS